MFTKVFWKDTIERAVDSGAGALLAVISIGATSFGEIPYEAWGLAFGIGFLTGVLKCLSFRKAGDPNTGSVVKKEEDEGHNKRC
jgi:hypothetical protein